MNRLIVALIILVISFFIVSVLLAGLTFVVYTRLTDEKPFATVYFQQDNHNVFRAYFTEENDSETSEYKIYGDQWRVDAQFIKIVPWANIFGINAQYLLERLEGRYDDIEDQNSQPYLAYDLGENNLFKIPQFLIDCNFLIDAEYGSSSYKEINVSPLYTVYRTQSGIIIRQASISKDADEDDFLDTIIEKVFD